MASFLQTIRRFADAFTVRQVTPATARIEDEWMRDSRNPYGAGVIGFIPNENDLAGLKGIEIYEKMENRDAAVRFALRMKRRAVLAVPFDVHPAELEETAPQADQDLAETQARFIRKVIDEFDGGFMSALDKLLNCFRSGVIVGEKIYRILPSGEFAGNIAVSEIRIHRIADITFNSDERGRIAGVVQQTNPAAGVMDPAKFVIATHNPNGDDAADIYGRSDLEPVWRYYNSTDYIERAWNVYLEKYAMPIAWGKLGAASRTEDDQADLEAVLDNIQAATRIVTPPDIELQLLEAKRQGGADYKERLEHNKRMTVMAILGGGELATQEGDQGAGSFAMSKTHFQSFMIEIAFLHTWFSEQILDRQFIAQLIDWNWPEGRRFYPRVKFRSVLADDQQAKAALVKTLKDAGLIDPREKWLREFVEIPAMDPELEDEIETERQARIETLPPAGETPGNGGDDEKGLKGKPGAAMSSRPPFRTFAVSRRPRFYERKVDFAEIDRRLTSFEERGVDELSEVVAQMGQFYVGKVKSLGVIEDKTARRIREIVFPNRLVADLRTISERWISRSFKSGAKDVRSELAESRRIRMALAARGKTIKMAASIEGTKLQQLLDEKAFRISGVISDDLLRRANQILVSGLDRGLSQDKVIDQLSRLFMDYAGDPNVLDDQGQELTPARLETIVRNNWGSAYNLGRRDVLLDPDLAGFITGVMYSSILDSRTTEICQFMDAKVFLASDPDVNRFTPGLHHNCRSTLVPVTAPESSEEPFTPISEAEKAEAIALIPEGF